MISSRILLALLSYVEPLPRKKIQLGPTFEWTIAQFEELQLHALAALAILLPRSINEYFEYHTGTKLLLFYEWTIANGKMKSIHFFLNLLFLFFYYFKMIIKVKEIAFLVKVVEIVNDHNYDIFFD